MDGTMKIIDARNVHQALSHGLYHLDCFGVKRDSRNGPVLVAPHTVATVYQHPEERVVFWPERDANPFFHIYESLWMLQGRNDIVPLARYAKNMMEFSDDGMTQNAAYGHRWRKYFMKDQLKIIADRLILDPSDRRSVLGMWDPGMDLGSSSKDVPCNLVVTFQIGVKNELNMTVFCRSNDILWGAYGANAVHFSVLMEYMANRIGVKMGRYTQISENFHGYEKTLAQVKYLPRDSFVDPYSRGEVRSVPLVGDPDYIDSLINDLLFCADANQFRLTKYDNEWANVMHAMLHAHHVYKSNSAPRRFQDSLSILAVPYDVDWICAGREWITRRFEKWDREQSSLTWRVSAEREAHLRHEQQQKDEESDIKTSLIDQIIQGVDRVFGIKGVPLSDAMRDSVKGGIIIPDSSNLKLVCSFCGTDCGFSPCAESAKAIMKREKDQNTELL